MTPTVALFVGIAIGALGVAAIIIGLFVWGASGGPNF